MNFEDLKAYQPLNKNRKYFFTSLVYTVFYFLPLFYQELSLVLMAQVLFFYLIFVAIYYYAVVSTSDFALITLISLVLWCGLCAIYYAGACSLYGFSTFLAGLYFKRIVAFVFLVFAVINISIVYFLLYYGDIYFIVTALAVSFGLAFMGILARQDFINILGREQDAKKMSALAAIAERERIARDLHDILGHTLLSISLKSELAYKVLEKGDASQAAREISEVHSISNEALDNVRNAVSGYKNKGLAGHLQNLKHQLVEQGFDVSVDTEFSQIGAVYESELILILTEAVSNILRHSKARNVFIGVKHALDHLSVSIKDDGRVDKLSKGNGLSGIEERIRILNGCVEFSQKNGFELHISLPLVT